MFCRSWSGVVLVLAWLSLVGDRADGLETLPNVVLIVADDLGWTDYGFMGHPQIETPHLDQLARRSAVFTRGYVPTALCRPSLATLITGLYAHQHKISGNEPAPLPEMLSQGVSPGATDEPAEYRALRASLIAQIDRQPTLPQLLARRGYLSFQAGKWWEGSFRRGGFTEGMTRGFPEPGGRHGDDGLTIGRPSMQLVLDFVDRCADQSRPFFLWYAPLVPHQPHDPPDGLLDKYRRKGIESEHVAKYYAMVERFDETCGELFDHLDRRQLTEKTLVVYVADNGWIQRPDAPAFALRSKQSANEGGVRTPILFSWPGVIAPSTRSDQLCCSTDVFPTIAAAAGVTDVPPVAGLDLLPCLRTGAVSPRDSVFGEGFTHDVPDVNEPEEGLLYRWIVAGRWKLLLTYDAKPDRHARHHPRQPAGPQLYDIVADPTEASNLAGDHPELVRELGERLQQWWPVSRRRVLSD